MCCTANEVAVIGPLSQPQVQFISFAGSTSISRYDHWTGRHPSLVRLRHSDKEDSRRR